MNLDDAEITTKGSEVVVASLTDSVVESLTDVNGAGVLSDTVVSGDDKDVDDVDDVLSEGVVDGTVPPGVPLFVVVGVPAVAVVVAGFGVAVGVNPPLGDGVLTSVVTVVLVAVLVVVVVVPVVAMVGGAGVIGGTAQ